MAKFRFLEHTADIMFEAYGKSLNELFENAALAVSESMVKTKDVKPKTAKIVKLQNVKVEMLLFDFLSELLYLKDAEQLVFSAFKVKVEEAKGNFSLQAELKGDKLNMKTQEFRNDVKAITLHLFEVKKEKAGWTARVIVDI
ncbi:archease [Candidatus Woesearchaeota archaeon]|nr:archease [Candidatus Woesearchaeota archaeon]